MKLNRTENDVHQKAHLQSELECDFDRGGQCEKSYRDRENIF